MIIKIDNLFDSKCNTIVNAVNCVGVMGKGIALEFKKRYPDMFLDYKFKCDRGEVKVGTPYFYDDKSGKQILNFPTKDHWRGKSKLSYVEDGLKWFVEHYQEHSVTSIAFTALGCGNGGLSWEVIGKLMYQTLRDLPIEIEIYAPFGTSHDMLTEEFLSSEIDYDKTVKQRTRVKKEKEPLVFNKDVEKVALVIKYLNMENDKLLIGKTVFTDLMYVLSYYDHEFAYKGKFGRYGVYCSESTEILDLMLKMNIIIEGKKGSLKYYRFNKECELNKYEYTEDDKKAISKTVSYFKELSSANETHLKANILYAYLKVKNKGETDCRQAVYDYLKDQGIGFKDDTFDMIYSK